MMRIYLNRVCVENNLSFFINKHVMVIKVRSQQDSGNRQMQEKESYQKIFG